jgi:hypothetical protein
MNVAPKGVKPGSMWLVVAECRYNVAVVDATGSGVFLPGQEPLWDFNCIREWVREIKTPKEETINRLKGHSATVNFEKADYDEETGEVSWKRALGSLKYDVASHYAFWKDDLTCEIDGKVIHFEKNKV